MGRRDNGEQSTRADAFDVEGLTGINDPTDPDYRDERRRLIPDHGRQPRYRRPSAAEYRRDSLHLRRPSGFHDPFDGCRPGEAPKMCDVDPKKYGVWEQLRKLAVTHAQRLRHYREDRVAALIEREIVPQVRKLLRGVVPPDQVASLVNEFTELVWCEIDNITKV
jgi:hypothetical protein